MTTTRSTNLRIRWATKSDVRAQFAIEQAWRHEKEDLWLPHHLQAFVKGDSHSRYSLVAVHAVRGVIGHLQFIARVDDLALMNVATHPAYCRLGVARRLLYTLHHMPIASLSRNTVQAVVRGRDLPSQLFLKHAGYRCTRIWHRWYETPSDDGYHFERHQGDAG